MKHARLFALAAAGALVGATAPAEAAQYLFTITGGFNATFSLPVGGAPDTNFSGVAILYEGVAGFDNYTASGTAELIFYSSALAGGLELNNPLPNDTAFYAADGDQLFTITGNDVSFQTGTFTLTDPNNGTGQSTLTISEVSGAVPEPASWAMMVAGFGLAGTAVRRRRRVTVTFA